MAWIFFARCREDSFIASRQTFHFDKSECLLGIRAWGYTGSERTSLRCKEGCWIEVLFASWWLVLTVDWWFIGGRFNLETSVRTVYPRHHSLDDPAFVLVPHKSFGIHPCACRLQSLQQRRVAWASVCQCWTCETSRERSAHVAPRTTWFDAEVVECVPRQWVSEGVSTWALWVVVELECICCCWLLFVFFPLWSHVRLTRASFCIATRNRSYSVPSKLQSLITTNACKRWSRALNIQTRIGLSSPVLPLNRSGLHCSLKHPAQRRQL